MTHDACAAVEPLIDSEAQGWSDSERLRVERHLESCADCLALLTMMRVVRQTVREAPATLSGAARERAIQRALSASALTPPATRTHPKRWLVGAALVAAAALLALTLREGPPPSAPRVAEAPVQQPAPAWIEAREPEQRSFAHAEVQLAAGARVRFETKDSTLQLDRGRVDVSVDPRKGAPFFVSTSLFRVEVLGTRFSVTPDSVQVQEGRVQVRAHNGQLLARDLGAGTSFTYTPASAKQAESKVETGPAPEPPPSVRVLLARAREALTHDNLKGARAAITRAENAHPQRAELAEAWTLRAELALLEHDSRAALRAYQRVAKQYADLAAGENAAFAAARLAARSEPAEEHALLTRYLQRYPQGRFADETRRRLQTLSNHP